MSPKRPPSVMGDDERAAAGREHRTPTKGIPVEIDPEITPPPSEPPNITGFQGWEDIPEHIREPMLALYNKQREQDIAVLRLWDARHVPQRLDVLGNMVHTLLERTKTFPEVAKATNSLAGAIGRFEEWAKNRDQFDRQLMISIRGLTSRLAVLERDQVTDRAGFAAEVAKLTVAMASAKNASDAAGAAAKELEERVRELEQDHVTEEQLADMREDADKKIDEAREDADKKIEGVKAELVPVKEAHAQARGAKKVLGPLFAIFAGAVGALLTRIIESWIGSGRK